MGDPVYEPFFEGGGRQIPLPHPVDIWSCFSSHFRFNDKYFNIDTGKPDFPRPAGIWWFGCTDEFALRNEGDEAINKQIEENSFDQIDDEFLLDAEDPDYY